MNNLKGNWTKKSEIETKFAPCKYPKRLINFWTIVKLKLSLLGVVLREKKEGGTFAKVKKIKKRLSQSFGKLSKSNV